MYFNLAKKNIIRDWKNYLIYFVTVTLVIMLMYSFLTLSFSKDIIVMSENMEMLSLGISILSIFVALIGGFMIKHAINLVLLRRKKEIALYFLMGMEENTIIRIFLCENFLMGSGAFILGCILGVGLSIILKNLALGIFGFPIMYSIEISAKAIFLTTILFFGMFYFGLRSSIVNIKKSSIYTLLYDEIRNENIKIKKGKMLGRLLLIVLFEVGGLFCIKRVFSIQTNFAIVLLIIGVLLLLSGIFYFYKLFPEIYSYIMKKRTRWLLKKTNLFLYGQISSKCKAAGKIMAVTSMLLSVALVTLFSGLVMGEGYKVNLKSEYPFDVAVAIDSKVQSFDEVVKYVSNREKVKESFEYNLYEYPDISNKIDILGISDYNKLREILGLKKVNLEQGQYIVHCDTWKYIDTIRNNIKQAPVVDIGGKKLEGSCNRIYDEPMEQYRMTGTNGYALVVPDIILNNLETHKSRLVIDIIGEGNESLKSELNRFIRNEWNPQIDIVGNERITMSLSVQAWGIKNSLTGFTTFAFIGLYLSVIFIIFSATLLAFEQLERGKNSSKYYKILQMLGVDNTNCKRLVFKELAIFFGIPMCLPLILFVIVALGANQMFGEYILKIGVIPRYILVTLGIFALVYSLYFYLTYILFSRKIVDNTNP